MSESDYILASKAALSLFEYGQVFMLSSSSSSHQFLNMIALY